MNKTDTSIILNTIAERLITPEAYSLGIMGINSPYIRPILEAFSGTRLHLYYYNESERPLFTPIYKQYNSRVMLISLQEAFSKFMTHLHINKFFYDYGIINDDYKDRPRELEYIWPRIRIGGVFICCNMNIFQKNWQKHPTILTNPLIVVKNKWIVIMAASRGATRYIYQVAKRIRLKIYHERYGTEGIIAGQATGLIVPPQSIVLHQVREPLASIRSLAVKAKTFSRYYHDMIGISYNRDGILWAMTYWYTWHCIADREAQWTYRIEDLSNIWDEWCEYVRIDSCDIPSLSTRVNTHSDGVIYPDVNWNILADKDVALTGRIKNLAKTYGYNID
jgi:hypothetical protein